MGRYFNKGRGNLPLTLAGGRSTSVPGNKWIELNGSDETTPSVMRAVRKGQLFRAPDPKPAPVEVKTEAVATEETPQDAAPAESKPQTAAKTVTKKKVAKKVAKKTAAKKTSKRAS